MRKRNILISTRLTEEEAGRFRAYAKLCGLTQSELVRMLIKGLLPQANPSEVFWAMLSELYVIYNSFRLMGESSVEIAEDARREQKQIIDFILQLQMAVTLPEKAVKLYGNNENLGN